MSRQLSSERCHNCGGREFVDAVDNHGMPYRGCARCRIVLPAPSPPAAPELPEGWPDGWRWYNTVASGGVPYLAHVSEDVELTIDNLREMLKFQGLTIVDAKDRAVLEAMAAVDEETLRNTIEGRFYTLENKALAKAELARRKP